MPVTEIKVPSAQPEAQPAAEQPAPPLGAFGGAQGGRALEQGGEELFGVGLASYHRAAEALAQDKETEFQKKALQIRDQYRTKFNMDAAAAHEPTSIALEKTRQEIEKSIGSKYALGLYKNNSLRNLRLIQESVDSHFEQENRHYQDTVYKDAQTISTRMLASMAEGPGFNPTSAEEKVQEIYDRAYQYADSHGLHDEQAQAHAEKEVGVSMDAYFDALTDKHSGRSSEEVKAEYAKWDGKNYLSKHVQQKVSASGYAQEARVAVRNVFDTTARLVNDPKFDGNPDPDGEPDIAAIQAKVGEYIREHPEQEEIALHEYNALRSQTETAFTQEVRRRVDRVVAATREDMKRPGPWNGVFHVDPTSRDYLWLLRNKSTALDPIIRSEYTTDERLQHERHDANAKAFKADLISMASREPDKFEKLTEADLFKMQDDKKYTGGFAPKFRLEEAGKVLKGLREQHAKGELNWIEKTVQGYLKQNIYTNKDEVLKAESGVLHNEIALALQEHLKAGTVKRDDWKSVNDFLTSETAKVGQTELFGGKFGGQYKAELDAQARAKAPAPAPAKPVTVAPANAPGPHKIINIKRNGKDMQWDDTIKDWVK